MTISQPRTSTRLKPDCRNKLERRLKSEKHTPWFDKWLDLMDAAYDILTIEAFTKLEDKIMAEINNRRKPR
jgi:hypothetical protein